MYMPIVIYRSFLSATSWLITCFQHIKYHSIIIKKGRTFNSSSDIQSNTIN